MNSYSSQACTSLQSSPPVDPLQKAKKRLRLLPLLCLQAAALLHPMQNKAMAVGASTPFTTYEAEAGTLAGGAAIVSLTSPPTTEFSSPQLEASGHAYVKLTAVGHSVTWTNNTGQNITAINIRASIPPTTDGNGQTATLDFYVNGSFRQALTLSSKQTWLWESSSNYDGMNHTSSGGTYPNPHVFWDEAHAFISGAAVAPGNTIMLKWDSSNTLSSSSIGSFYYIDCVDLEQPPAALSQPSNSLSILSYGAQANNSGFDNTTAIQNCINAALAQSKSVWIPSGTFYLGTPTKLNPSGVTINGAGPWYSVLYTNPTLPASGSSGFAVGDSSTTCTIQNLRIDGNARSSASGDGNGTAMNMKGSNWLISNVWTQHHLGVWADGTNGTVQNCRVTNSWGDGINVNNGNTGHSGNQITVQNNFVRGSGDDSIAVNSDASSNQMQSPQVLNNTTVAPWWANGMGIYGGANVVVQDNLVTDSVKEHGVYIGVFGNSGAGMSGATIQGNTVLRGGSFGSALDTAAMQIGTNSETNGISNVVADSNMAENSMFESIRLEKGTNVTLQNSSVNAPGLEGILISSVAVGNGILDNNLVTNVASGQVAYANDANPANYSVLYKNEGEFLTVSSITSGLTNSVITAPQFSNGEAAFVNANAVGQQVTYLIPSLLAGNYDVKVGVKKHSTRGTWQMAIAKVGGGFVNLGSPVDEYSASDSFTAVDLGTWSPGTSTDKLFQLTITGKNASSTGYDISVDYILITPQ
jgi:hypothetical protein